MTHMVMEAADLCDDRLVLRHEGGYHKASAPFFGLAVIEQLSDIRTGVQGPYLPVFEHLGQQ